MFLNESIYDIKEYKDQYGNPQKKKRINIPFVVKNNKIETGEELVSIDHVYINGLYEIGIQKEIKETSHFKVDYKNGTIFTHSSQEGQTLNLTYTAKAQIRYKAKNTVIEDLDDNYVGETVEDVLKESADRINNLILGYDNNVKEVNERVDNLILNQGNSPAELVDARISTVKGITYTVANDRFNATDFDVKELQDSVGDTKLTELNTNEKSSIVGAVNEVNSQLDNMTTH